MTELFRRRAEGAATGELCRLLTERGLPTPAGAGAAADLNLLYQAISRSPGGHDAWAHRYGLPRAARGTRAA